MKEQQNPVHKSTGSSLKSDHFRDKRFAASVSVLSELFYFDCFLIEIEYTELVIN